MGQEKSLPVRCNPTSTIQNTNYRISQISTKSGHSAVSATSSNASAISTSSHDSTDTTTTLNNKTSRPPSSTSRTSYKTVDRQSKYLSEHLYIKSYLDIEEEDRNAKKSFHSAQQGGIRSYKPKILTEKQKQKTKSEVDVWI